MGVVWLARRADGAYEQEGALKLIQRELGGAHLLERFRRERQVLAHLEHRGIARLIDGGSTQDGTPYLVMEHVEGVPIDRYCDAAQLSVRARLVLFLEVCDGVQHAHEHLVVHRDLKPSNILVTAAGEPKLLDFGIAKVLDPEAGPAGPEATIGVLRFLTPAYASPEQVAGGPITTASDVYSLGVVLYQLLCGQLPYRVDSTSAAEIERIVCGTEPGRPSEALRAHDEAEGRARACGSTPRALVRALEGDLDRIVLKGLRKEPRQRYASVAELALDLRRHLSGEPVSARPDTFLYRASKFVRRHRTPVGAAAMVLGALVTGLVLSLVQYRRAEAVGQREREQRELAEALLGESRRLAQDLERERAAAELRLAEVERLNQELAAQSALARRRFEDVHGFATKLVFDLHGVLYPLAGTTRALELVVETGLAYLDRLAAEARDDATLQRELAHAYLRIAEIQGGLGVANLGRLDQALSSADKAVAIGEALLCAAPDELPNSYTLALALSGRASLLRQAGAEERALADYRRAVDVGRALEARPEANVGQLLSVVVARGSLAELLQPRVPAEEALTLFSDCVAPLERLIALYPQPTYLAERELLRVKAAEVEHDLGEGSAVERMVAALETLERIGAAQPEDRILARKVRYARAILIPILAAEGGGEWARELLARNAAELDAALAADPVDYQAALDRIDVARGFLRLAEQEGDLRQGLVLGERELVRARELVEREPASAFAGVQLAALLVDLGLCQRRLELAARAEQRLGEACALLDGILTRSPGMLLARREHLRAEAELARLLRASVSSAPDAAGARARLASAVERFGSALAEGEALAALGTPGLESELARLRQELAESGGPLPTPAAGE